MNENELFSYLYTDSNCMTPAFFDGDTIMQIYDTDYIDDCKHFPLHYQRNAWDGICTTGREHINLRAFSYSTSDCVESDDTIVETNDLVVEECTQYTPRETTFNVVLKCHRDGIIRAYQFDDDLCAQPSLSFDGQQLYLDIEHVQTAGRCEFNLAFLRYQTYQWSGFCEPQEVLCEVHDDCNRGYCADTGLTFGDEESGVGKCNFYPEDCCWDHLANPIGGDPYQCPEHSNCSIQYPDSDCVFADDACIYNQFNPDSECFMGVAEVLTTGVRLDECVVGTADYLNNTLVDATYTHWECVEEGVLKLSVYNGVDGCNPDNRTDSFHFYYDTCLERGDDVLPRFQYLQTTWLGDCRPAEPEPEPENVTIPIIDHLFIEVYRDDECTDQTDTSLIVNIQMGECNYNSLRDLYYMPICVEEGHVKFYSYEDSSCNYFVDVVDIQHMDVFEECGLSRRYWWDGYCAPVHEPIHMDLRTFTYSDSSCQVWESTEHLDISTYHCEPWNYQGFPYYIMYVCQEFGTLRGYLFADSKCSERVTFLGGNDYVDFKHGELDLGVCEEFVAGAVYQRYVWDGDYCSANIIRQINRFGYESSDCEVNANFVQLNYVPLNLCHFSGPIGSFPGTYIIATCESNGLLQVDMYATPDCNFGVVADFFWAQRASMGDCPFGENYEWDWKGLCSTPEPVYNPIITFTQVYIGVGKCEENIDSLIQLTSRALEVSTSMIEVTKGFGCYDEIGSEFVHYTIYPRADQAERIFKRVSNATLYDSVSQNFADGIFVDKTVTIVLTRDQVLRDDQFAGRTATVTTYTYSDDQCTDWVESTQNTWNEGACHPYVWQGNLYFVQVFCAEQDVLRYYFFVDDECENAHLNADGLPHSEEVKNLWEVDTDSCQTIDGQHVAHSWSGYCTSDSEKYDISGFNYGDDDTCTTLEGVSDNSNLETYKCSHVEAANGDDYFVVAKCGVEGILESFWYSDYNCMTPFPNDAFRLTIKQTDYLTDCDRNNVFNVHQRFTFNHRACSIEREAVMVAVTEFVDNDCRYPSEVELQSIEVIEYTCKRYVAGGLEFFAVFECAELGILTGHIYADNLCAQPLGVSREFKNADYMRDGCIESIRDTTIFQSYQWHGPYCVPPEPEKPDCIDYGKTCETSADCCGGFDCYYSVVDGILGQRCLHCTECPDTLQVCETCDSEYRNVTIDFCDSTQLQVGYECESAFDGIADVGTNGWAINGVIPSTGIFVWNHGHTIERLRLLSGVGRNDGHHIDDFVLRYTDSLNPLGSPVWKTFTNMNFVDENVDGAIRPEGVIRLVGQDEIELVFDQVLATGIQIKVEGTDATNENLVMSEIFIEEIVEYEFTYVGDGYCKPEDATEILNGKRIDEVTSEYCHFVCLDNDLCDGYSFWDQGHGLGRCYNYGSDAIWEGLRIIVREADLEPDEWLADIHPYYNIAQAAGSESLGSLQCWRKDRRDNTCSDSHDACISVYPYSDDQCALLTGPHRSYGVNFLECIYNEEVDAYERVACVEPGQLFFAYFRDFACSQTLFISSHVAFYDTCQIQPGADHHEHIKWEGECKPVSINNAVIFLHADDLCEEQISYVMPTEFELDGVCNVASDDLEFTAICVERGVLALTTYTEGGCQGDVADTSIIRQRGSEGECSSDNLIFHWQGACSLEEFPQNEIHLEIHDYADSECSIYDGVFMMDVLELECNRFPNVLGLYYKVVCAFAGHLDWYFYSDEDCTISSSYGVHDGSLQTTHVHLQDQCTPWNNDLYSRFDWDGYCTPLAYEKDCRELWNSEPEQIVCLTENIRLTGDELSLVVQEYYDFQAQNQEAKDTCDAEAHDILDMIPRCPH